MKRIIVFAGLLGFCLPQVFPFQSEDYYDYSFARMTYIKGDVFIERADGAYEEGSVNLPLVKNDKLGTREGRAEIHFGYKNYLRIDSYTHVDFVSLPQRGFVQVKLNIPAGSVYLRVSHLEREKDFEVHTPDASFYIMEEGLYGFRVRESSETEVFVASGLVEAAGETDSVLVHAQEKMVASNGHFSADPTYSQTDYGDNFSEWNRSRDELISQRVQKAYLPQEMSSYEEELAYNGDWTYEYPYGNVWVPRVYHSTWRPYLYGRWVWYAVCGWCWVPYETWGWCVSHYGRWHWRFGLGWYWIPSHHWGPAWVHWYSGYDYIGWCPISYYGHPVVIVNNHFYGRGYGYDYPLHSRALTVVHRNQLQAPRISKAALDQSHVQRLGKVSLSEHQPEVKYSGQNRLTNAAAARVLERSNIRKVERSFTGASTLEVSPRTRETAVRDGMRSSPDIRSSKSPASGQTRPQGSERTSRYDRNAPSSRYDSGGALRDSSARESRTPRSIQPYPSRQVSYSGSRSYGIPRESVDSSGRYAERSSVKNYSSQSVSSRETRESSPYTHFRQSRSEIFDRSSSQSSSVKRYPSRNSYPASPFTRTDEGDYRSSSTIRGSYPSSRSYSGESGYRSSYRYESSSHRISPERSYSMPQSYSQGKYNSPRGSSYSYSNSRSPSAPSSSHSSSRVGSSSSRGSSVQVSRSSSGSVRSSSSSSSRRRK